MRIVFMGTPDFAVPSLQMLRKDPDVTVVGVVTQPDRPRGRKGVVTPSPVKQVAQGLPIWQPERVSTADSVAVIASWQPDLIVTVAYGQILKKALLDVPAKGCVNLHASLLPRWRGAAPIQRAIMAGDEETGVTTMYMDEGMDTGDIILQQAVPISSQDTAETLHDRLSTVGAALLGQTVRLIKAGTAPRRKQDEALATIAGRLTRADEEIDWTRSASQIALLVRALHPAPGAFTYHRGEILKVWQAQATPENTPAVPGTIISADQSGLCVQTGDGLLRIQRVQRENKRATDVLAYLRGRPWETGEKLGWNGRP
jgi:methionyl-tRNA formyltransferase